MRTVMASTMIIGTNNTMRPPTRSLLTPWLQGLRRPTINPQMAKRQPISIAAAICAKLWIPRAS